MQREFKEVELTTNNNNMYTGKFEEQAQKDTGMSKLELITKMGLSFAGQFNPALPLNVNLKNIGKSLEAKEKEGKDLTQFEKIVLGIYKKAELEINSISEQKKSEMVKKYLPYAAVGLGLYLILK